MITTIDIPASAGYGSKPWVAKITGRDPKYTFARTFCSATVTEPGVYAASKEARRSGAKNETRYYAVVRLDNGDLYMSRPLSDETLALLVDGYLDRMEKVQPRPYGDKDGYYIRQDGKITERGEVSSTTTHSLFVERQQLLARLYEIDAILASEVKK